MSDEEKDNKEERSIKQIVQTPSPLGCLPAVLGIIIALLACANWGKLSNATARWLDGQCNCNQCK